MSAPLAEAANVAQKIVQLLRPWTTRAEIAGSVRRRKPEVKDIEVVCEPARSMGILEDRYMVDEIREVARFWGQTPKNGERYIQVENVLDSGLKLDLFLVHPPAEWGPILAIRTGPAAFSEMLVTRIKGRLWRCQEGRVVNELGEVVPCPTEEDFFRAAGLEYLPPERRSADVQVPALGWRQ